MTQIEQATKWLINYQGPDQALIDAALDVDFGADIPDELLDQVLRESGAAEPQAPTPNPTPKPIQQVEPIPEPEIEPVPMPQVPEVPWHGHLHRKLGIDLEPGHIVTFRPEAENIFLKKVYTDWDASTLRVNPRKTCVVVSQERETKSAVRCIFMQDGKKFTQFIPKATIQSIN